MPPAGWPAAVPEPGHPEFVRRAVAWLLDLGPGEWRTIRTYVDYPPVLAHRAVLEVEGRLEAARRAYSSARRALGDVVGPEAVEATLTALEAEGAAVTSTVREVRLVAAVLLERRWPGSTD